jgi:hypothetical protein
MSIINWIAEIIARQVTEKVVELLKVEFETLKKIQAVSSEAKDLMGELDNAQTESERKAILRKIANFSDVSLKLL